MKYVKLTDFLTDDEIDQTVRLFAELPEASFAYTIARSVIAPNLERINATLGQPNDPLYLAYAVEYALAHMT